MTIESNTQVNPDDNLNTLEIFEPEGFERGKQPPTHIVFLIHGIGYKMFDQSKFQENVITLSKNLKEVLKAKYKDSGMRIMFIPIAWAEEFHALTTVDGRMNKITLPTIPGMRVITNDCLSDVLYYFTDFHRQHLLDIVCKKMNEAYKKLKEFYPEFDGHVGLISHSLGGVISYDLLTVKNQEVASDDHLHNIKFPRTVYPKLDFEPSFLFTLGSPIAAVMVLRGLKYEDFCLSEDMQFINIYHPYDPLAYRIEPLISSSYDTMEPEPIDICNITEGSNFLPDFYSYLPEPPSFIKSARSMFGLSITESEVEIETGSDTYTSSEGEEIDALEHNHENIQLLKPASEDDLATRSLSQFSVTAVGLKSFKRHSVIEKLHELKTRSSASSLSNTFYEGSSRRSSFYQAAVESISPSKNLNATHTSNYKYKRPSVLRASTFNPPTPDEPKSAKINNAHSKHNDLNSPAESSISHYDNLFSIVNDADKGYVKVHHSKATEEETKKHRKHALKKYPKIPRSKTFTNLNSLQEGYDEEQIMWFWGSMAFGMKRSNTSSPILEESVLSPSIIQARPLPKDPSPLRKEILSKDNPNEEKKSAVKAQQKPVPSSDDLTISPPKLIKNLTPNLNRVSFLEVPNTLNDIQNDSHKKDYFSKQEDLEVKGTINMLDNKGRSKSYGFIRHEGNNEVEDALLQEKDILETVEKDTILPYKEPKSDKESSKGNLKRYDHTIQAAVASNLSMEYFVGLKAHFCYWDNKDVANLMLKSMQNLPISKSDRK